jgi:sulfite exporter TauE/SafE
MTAQTLTMALLMGLTGSLHCAGMCGPIIWVMSFHFMSGFRKWTAILLYHLGRVSVYALLGLLLYSVRSLFKPGIQQYISIALGGLLVLAGILSFLPGHLFRTQLPWTNFLRKGVGRFIGNPQPGALFIAGILNGLLPCGMVYMALSAAVVAPDRLMAIAAMYAFGLGTIPMLVAVTVLRHKTGLLRSGRIKKLAPLTMFLFGVLFVIRGMNLGIPYFSPKIEVTKHEVKSSCCHKK